MNELPSESHAPWPPCCNICKDQLRVPGALLFSPPEKDGRCQKWHLCAACFMVALEALHPEQQAPQAPHPTGKPPEPILLTGKLVPFDENRQPIYLRMPGSPALYIPCFSHKETLESVMKRAGAPPYAVIISVADRDEFLNSIPLKTPTGEPIHIIIDPWFTADGKVRFTQLLRD